ncbi:MAG: nitroreductase family protein [Clostridia bacterium]|nr:nitroreductase family protein [Clostridia bacterium]
MTETQRIIKERSSIRAYTDEKLTKEQIQALVTAGLQAPTAANRQELHFTVLEHGSDILTEFEQAFRKAAAPDKTEEERAAMNCFYYNAPVVIMISGDKESTWDACDSGIAVENIALAAQSMGLGNLIIGCLRRIFDTPAGAEWEKKLFPENYRFDIAIAVGHANTTKVPHEYDEEALVTYL